MPGAFPSASLRTTATPPINVPSRRAASRSCGRRMSWYPATTRRFPPDVIRMAPDLATFDALCDERFDGWVDELREVCAIPSETDQFPDLERAAGVVADRLRAAGA